MYTYMDCIQGSNPSNLLEGPTTALYMQLFGVLIICSTVITHVSHKVFITDILFFAFSKSFCKVNSKEMFTLWILEKNDYTLDVLKNISQHRGIKIWYFGIYSVQFRGNSPRNVSQQKCMNLIHHFIKVTSRRKKS